MNPRAEALAILSVLHAFPGSHVVSVRAEVKELVMVLAQKRRPS